jgi:oligopeptide transport system substrate-binding protein
MSIRSSSLFLLLFLLACSPQERHADKMVFNYNESAGVSSLDPAFSNNLENIWWVSQIFSGLVELGSHQEILPSIAESWEISEDGMEYIFHLREDVLFHPHEALKPGRSVTAADFVYSFQRIMDPKTASPGLWIFDVMDSEKPFEAIDDLTMRMRLKRPFPPFLGMLTMTFCSVIPHEVVEFHGNEFRANPIGTGPFRMNFWMEGLSLALVKNETYFMKDDQGNALPYLDAVSVSFVPDKSTMFLDFLKGRYDMISGLHQAYRNELLDENGELTAAYANRFYLISQAALKTDYLGFLVDPELKVSAGTPWLDPRVRKAMDLSLDKVQMVRYIKNNTAIPASSGFVPPSCYLKEAVTEEQGMNRAEALRLLAEAGYPKAKGIPSITLSTTADYIELCEFIQFQLADMGFQVKVDVLPTSIHREGVSKGEIAFFRKSWIADYADPENFLALFYAQNEAPKGANYTHYADNQYDAWYELALSKKDPLVRDSLYHLMDQKIMEDAPIIPLFYDKVMRFVSKNITGLESNAMNGLDLRHVRKQ